MLKCTKISKSYHNDGETIQVLNQLDLSIGAGEAVALMGDSGSGKSTLMHIIAGLDNPDAGDVVIDGRMVTGESDANRAAMRRSLVGLIFQQFNLIPSLSVGENIAFQAKLAGRLDPAWLDEICTALGIAGLEGRYPEQLSGGQQQRVAIARCFATRPKLILADEPTGNLDEHASESVIRLSLDLVQKTGCSFLMVTHSSLLAKKLGTVFRLSHGKLVSAQAA